MVLNESQIQLIEFSWEVINENPLSMLKFYDHLFEIAPETIHFFPDDIRMQSDKLAHTMNFIVTHLNKLDNIECSINELGRFHNKLEIEPSHYSKLKVALIRTIKENMGEKYEESIGQAWETTLDYLSARMLGAKPVRKSKWAKIRSWLS